MSASNSKAIKTTNEADRPPVTKKKPMSDRREPTDVDFVLQSAARRGASWPVVLVIIGQALETELQVSLLSVLWSLQIIDESDCGVMSGCA